ncbi:LacI family DNA-binding transcriptional regulator [Bradyrhizobium ganzhouense]|uniref:LacI family DNA-binding transcriptional regulator n=1 Tax=Bradyrhizobium ganzhouense TaxID=1179767 RepID=UPI003CEDEDD8
MKRAKKTTGKPTIRDVAKAAAVSQGTASRVINQLPVKPALKARVDDAISNLGYTPNALAQGMRLRSTRTIGILIRDFSVPGFASFVKVAQNILSDAGYVLMLAGSEDRPEREREILNAFIGRADGLILSTSSSNNSFFAKPGTNLSLPVIMLDREPSEQQDAILIAHREGMHRALRHLFELGHRRVALITGNPSLRPARERILGYREAHIEHSIEIDEALIRTRNFSKEYALTETTALLASNDRPTAIIVGGVAMLQGVLRAIKICNLRIPEDISLIGGTDPELAELVVPSVTVIEVDYHAIGVEAAQLLLDRINNRIDASPRIIKFDSTLIIRQSCAAPSPRPAQTEQRKGGAPADRAI